MITVKNDSIIFNEIILFKEKNYVARIDLVLSFHSRLKQNENQYSILSRKHPWWAIPAYFPPPFSRTLIVIPVLAESKQMNGDDDLQVHATFTNVLHDKLGVQTSLNQESRNYFIHKNERSNGE